MKNIYFNFINNQCHFWVLLLAICIGNTFSANAQVFKAATQRTSSYTPNKKIYNIQGDFAIIGNTILALMKSNPFIRHILNI